MDRHKFIPLMVPDITEEDISAVSDVLRSGMLVQGENVIKLEDSIANYLGVKHAVAVSSGTASLHIALLALGIGPGDEVIVPAFSFMATANVVEIVGAKPVFVDIDIRTFNIDTNQIESAITPNTKVIMPVHEFGLACDITAICQIAQKHGLTVIEDAACALGATESGRFAGTLGSAGSFSFHPRKAITSGEGGMLVTNDDALASVFRSLRNHGISDLTGKMEFMLAGLNYRMTDFQAALLSSQFKRFNTGLSIKQDIAIRYQQNLGSMHRIKTPVVPKGKVHTWQSYHIVTENSRDECIGFLKSHGVRANLGAQCMPLQFYYQKKYGLDCQIMFPNSTKAFRQGIALPIYPKLELAEVDYICETIISFDSGSGYA